MPYNEPDASGTMNPIDVVNHLLLIWPVEYIEHSPTKHTQPGKQSDVIVVDAVDLDAVGEDGQEGLLVRGAWWRPGFLIRDLKKKIGARDPFLARMWREGEGGTAPYKLISATKDPDSVLRAEAWQLRNPDFSPGSPGIPNVGHMAVTAPTLPPPPVAAPSGPVETVLERMARQAHEAKRGGFTTSPQDEKPPW